MTKPDAIEPTHGELPVFTGESWEDHVSSWLEVSRQTLQGQLRLAAIAHSVAGKWKRQSVNQFAGEVGIRAARVYDYIRVYNLLKNSARAEILDSPLSFNHLLAASYADDPDEALHEAEDENLSVEAMRERIQERKTRKASTFNAGETCTVSDLHSLIEQNRKFKTIYADPPWKYGNQSTRAATDNHYDTMGFEEIAALPITDLADDTCHLHLWTTNGFLKDALTLIELWGFEFKSTFVWAKSQLGIGNYWRCSHEILLLGVRGNLTFPPSDIKSWVELPRAKHSEKPDHIRALIERVSPAPRIELFGRRVSAGWTTWGDEIKRTLLDGEVIAA